MNHTIQCIDKYNIKEKHSSINYSKNYAKLIINDEVVEVTNNMVIMPGRQYTAQRLTNKYPVGYTDCRDYTLTHFGIGSGGSSTSGGVVVLTGPDLCDTDLTVPTPLHDANTTYLTSPSGVNYVCKAIEVDGTIEFASDPNVTCTSTYMNIIKNTCIINNTEPTYLASGIATKIDEACLYITYSSNTVAFAKICFYPKYITKEDTLTIEWYIIC